MYIYIYMLHGNNMLLLGERDMETILIQHYPIILLLL